MRQLRKNRQVLYYASYKGVKPIYATTENYLTTEDDKLILTEDGKILIGDVPLMTDVDGEMVAVVDAYKDEYSVPAIFTIITLLYPLKRADCPSMNVL